MADAGERASGGVVRGPDHDVPQMGELCAKATAAGDHTRLALMLRTK